MKKYEVVVCCLIFVIEASLIAQENNVRGSVIDASSSLPLKGVKITQPNTTIVVFTDANGVFTIELISNDPLQLVFSLKGYKSKVIAISDSKNLLSISLEPEISVFSVANVIDLSDDDLLDNDIGGANVITGVLESSKDVFTRTAAFNFGQARFKVRGYDNREGTVLFNGVVMNKIQNGRPQWSNWGGLNDVLRNFNYSYGIAASEDGFGGVLGQTNFKTNATEYRKGTAVSIAASNASYKTRLMTTHATGLLQNNWAFTVSLSSRLAKDGRVPGTSYKAFSGFLAAEKKINAQNSLNFNLVYAFNERGRSAANTQEVIDLKGASYNNYWGNQEGKIRNANMQQVNEPLLLFSHKINLREQSKLTTTFSYQFGKIGRSRLASNGLENPYPAYYKYLPSYALQFNDYANAYLLQQQLKNDGQINWTNFYSINQTIAATGYYQLEDVTKDKQFSVQSFLNHRINRSWELDAGWRYRALKSDNYALLKDDFSGNGLLDVDPYEIGVLKENNLLTKGRIVQQGDAFSYNYNIAFSAFEIFAQTAYQALKYEVSLGVNYNNTQYQRTGNYLNANYAETSLGASEKLNFFNFSTKVNMLYKFSGKHLLSGNFGLLSRAPFLNNAFTNIRVSNEKAKYLQNEKIYTTDISYRYRSESLKGRATAYHTLFVDAMENSFVFAEGLLGNNADFVSQSLTGIDKKHMGLELGLEWEINAEFSADFVAAVGVYTYANNPNLTIGSHAFSDTQGDLGTAFLKNYKIGGTPQKAFSVGVNYKNPDYWWVALNGNFLIEHYVQIAPLLRTANFYLDTDGVPFVNPETGMEITQEEVDALLTQERFPYLFLLNALGGKSWKFGEDYLGLFISVNNILGEVYKTGGFEQARKANFQELQADKNLQTPLFGNKYWMQNGTTFFAILSYRF